MESTSLSPTKRILVALDLSDECHRLVESAFRLAEQSPGTEVHAVNVAELLHSAGPEGLAAGILPSNPGGELGALLARVVDDFTASCGAPKVASISGHVRWGDPAFEIVQLAAALDADLILIGTHGRTGLARLLLGSVAERVARTAGCPVLIERPKHHDDASKVPEIEPLCPKCSEARERTGGAELWCARHVEHHAHGHVYHYQERAMSDSCAPGFTST